MKPVDFKNATPRLVIEDYFNGKTRASGMFEDRFGNLRRQFTVDITGTWDGDALVLDEHFLYADGERDRRVWTITKTGPNTYQGHADDVIGSATGQAYGNALNWRYEMDLKVGDGTLRVHFNDWMFLQPSGMLLNRARVSKLGVEIGTVTLAFVKDGFVVTNLPGEQPDAHATGQAASQ
ncbi:MAG: DUF3833 domain-containing protein [Rhodospirillales bacterium]